ncbi:actin assembly-inducing protein ActA [Listeria ivanovii]|uniref:actin assembly-inducing protein ActA n=1 Tax=Listeria ivanovii TaxID=1638 RepID=UPI001FB41343|nr:actin assembly-inducing protein ActA [Listeria ivanovii]MCJ1718548.1 actin assembly-inducing protein ActA [Listeria ivanovii]MCJ1723765.1 actin assembly-inducing protein ActA [Listeria ivanovii]MCJ1736423.1 actin assembly-inducing protein ActA [Listeria ivanovii]
MKLDRFLRAMMAVCFTASCILVNPGVIFASNSTVSTSSNENSNLESDEQGEGEQAEGKVEEGRNSPGHGAISEACARDIQELGKTGEAKSANVPDSMTTPDSGLSKEPGQNIGETVTKSKPPSVRKRFKRCVEKVLKGKRNKSSKEETKTTKKKQESSKLQPKELVPHPSIANQSFWRRLSDKIKPVVTSNDDNDSRIDSDEWDDGEEAKEKVEEGKAEEEKNNLGQEEISEERERDLQELEKMGKVKNANVTALLAMLDSRAGKVARQDIKETLNDEVPAVLFHPKRSIKEILSDEQNRVPMNSGKIKNRRKAIEGSDMEDSDMEDADTEEKPLAHGATGPLRTMNPSTSEETSEKIQSNENNEESSNQSQFDLLSSSTEEGLRIALPEPPGLLGFNMQNNELESSVSEPSSFNLSSPPTEEELAAMGITLSVTPSVEEESSLHLPKEDAPQSLTANPSLEFPSPPTEEELAAMDMKQSIAPTVEGESSLRPSREDAPQSLTANPSLEFPSPPTEEELAAMGIKQSMALSVGEESSLHPSREDVPQSLTANPSLEFPSPPTRAELAAMGIFMFNDGLLRGDLGSAGNAIERQSSSCLDSPTCSYFYGFHTDDEYSDSEDELDSLLNPKVTAIGETKKTSQQYRKVGFMPFVPLLEKPFAGGNGTLAEEQIIKNPLGKTKQELQLQDSIEQQLTLAKKLQDNAEKAAETTEVSKTNETTKTNETIKTAILPKTEPAEGLSLLTNSTQTVGSTLKVSRNKLHSPQKTTGTLKSENSSLIPAGMPIIPLESLEKRKEQPKTNLAEGTLKNNKLVEKSEGKNTPSRSGSEKLVAKSAEREKTNQEAGNNTVLMYALVAIGIISLAVIIKIIRTRKSD